MSSTNYSAAQSTAQPAAQRVVVTGMAGFSPLGHNWVDIQARLRANESGVVYISEWEQIHDLNTKLGAPVKDFEPPAAFNRKITRTMGRVAKLATVATVEALAMAGIQRGDKVLTNGRCGVSYGSCTGSTDAVLEFTRFVDNQPRSGVNGTSYIRMMSHTCAVNIGVYFGLTGRTYTTTSACTSGSQGIGYAYEAIKHGQQDMMIAGGAEELCPSEAAAFDTLYATSTKNDQPTTTPAPFDRDRDGLVIGEGACTLVLESLAHAQARGATVLAEIVGFATNADGTHVTQPNAKTQEVAIRQALDNAGVTPADIGYVCAHGTATDRGDIAESKAVATVFGQQTPLSSFKGHIGHTLGACGALESWWSIEMMRAGQFAPTLNLQHPDPECAELDYIISEHRQIDTDYVMNNNFAFGGINTSLIFKRWAE